MSKKNSQDIDQLKNNIVAMWLSIKAVHSDTKIERRKNRRGTLTAEDHENLAMAYLDFSCWCERFIKENPHLATFVKKELRNQE